jgi:exodeoxyribonuclease-3
MRVLSWNIRQGGGRRLTDIAAAIDSHQPDVVVINELRARTAPALIALLSGAGLSFEEHTGPVSSESGILVASRFPLRRLPPSPPSMIFRHGLLEVEVPNWGIIGAVYGPMLTPAHSRFWNEFAKYAATRVGSSHLLIGDFNTGEAGIDAYKKPFAGSVQFLAIKAAGYVDLWRTTNAVTEHTWFSFGRGGVPLNGFRIDHALASPHLAKRLLGCRYSHAERERRLSDHSILLVDFVSSDT